MTSIKIPVWLEKKTEIGSSLLFRKTTRNSERNKNMPLPFLFRKTFVYLASVFTGKIYLRRCSKVGKRPKTHRRPYIENMGEMTIGDDIDINSRNVQTELITRPGGALEIRDEVDIDFGVSIQAHKKIKIGNRTHIGPYTTICDANIPAHCNRFKQGSGDPIVIEDDVWLASKVVVLKGSRIGRGSLIAAGSVVSGIVPPYVVAGGTPARVLRYLDPPPNSGFHWEHNARMPVIKESILYRVRKIASEIFSTDIDSIRQECSHYSVPNWNSLQHVKFIHALEREFDIQIKKEDWTGLSSIGKIAHVVQSYVDRKHKGYKPVEIIN